MSKSKTLQARVFVGELRIALRFGARHRDQLRLQHCGCAIPGSYGVWPRYGCLHSSHPDIGRYAFLSNRFRKSCRATEFSGGEKRGLSRIPQECMGMRHHRRASFAAVSGSYCGLPQFAEPSARGHARSRSSILRSAGKPARIHPGRYTVSIASAPIWSLKDWFDSVDLSCSSCWVSASQE